MNRKVLTIIGTRPNFIKVTQFNKYLNRPEQGIEHKILHTGQHYDDKMSMVFFEQFGLQPDHWLNVKPASPNTQIAHIMLGLEKVIDEEKPDLIIVVGDVNSTYAAAITAHKCGVPFAHVESGLRSEDLGMPEENNRILTDSIANFFFVTEQSGWDNLIRDGQPEHKIFFVGNTMIDTLVAFEPKIEEAGVLEEYKLQTNEYALMTMHRPATVDNKENLLKLFAVIREITSHKKLVFPIHPRTLSRVKSFGLHDELMAIQDLVITGPLDYFAFQKLIKYSSYVVTDSGGIQEETTFRKVPCITLRPNTERPSTVTEGTNTLATLDPGILRNLIQQIENGTYKTGIIPKMWDGKATERIAQHIRENIFKLEKVV